jgi:hypothetical protein
LRLQAQQVAFVTCDALHQHAFALTISLSDRLLGRPRQAIVLGTIGHSFQL